MLLLRTPIKLRMKAPLPRPYLRDRSHGVQLFVRTIIFLVHPLLSNLIFQSCLTHNQYIGITHARDDLNSMLQLITKHSPYKRVYDQLTSLFVSKQRKWLSITKIVYAIHTLSC